MDYTGFIFGNIKIIKRADGDLERCQKSLKEMGRTTNPIYTCECLLCGKMFNRNIYAIKRNKFKNCGCQSLQYDLRNQRFGKLIAVKPIGLNKHKELKWECICDCGNTYITTSYSLRTKKAKQCKNCSYKQIAEKKRKYILLKNTNENIKYKNNDIKCFPIKLRQAYTNMKSRCYNPNVKSYEDYGKRGIKLCDEWANSFMVFAKWALENGYQDNLEIDRIDNNGNYEPNNCRFVTKREQANNRRTNLFLEYNGEKDTMANWSRRLNIPYYYIQYRFYKGIEFKDIVNEFNNGARRTRKKRSSQ